MAITVIYKCDGECGKSQPVRVEVNGDGAWEDPSGWFNLSIQSDTRVLPAAADGITDALAEMSPEIQKLQAAYLSTAQQKFRSSFHLCPDCFSGLGQVATVFLSRQHEREYRPDSTGLRETEDVQKPPVFYAVSDSDMDSNPDDTAELIKASPVPSFSDLVKEGQDMRKSFDKQTLTMRVIKPEDWG